MLSSSSILSPVSPVPTTPQLLHLVRCLPVVWMQTPSRNLSVSSVLRVTSKAAVRSPSSLLPSSIQVVRWMKSSSRSSREPVTWSCSSTAHSATSASSLLSTSFLRLPVATICCRTRQRSTACGFCASICQI